jgi:hypothetical protein
LSNQQIKPEPPSDGNPSTSADPHSKLFASWLKLMAVSDPQARAKGMSELREQIKQIEQADKGKENE